MSDQKVRIRVATKQTAKNYWQLECTVEADKDCIIQPKSKEDLGDVMEVSLADKIWDEIIKVEERARQDGRMLVSDIGQI